MKIVIWGAGEMGRRVVPYIGKENVEAYIDSNTEKIGTMYMGIPIISLDDFETNYCGCPILITPLAEEGIENELMNRGIDFYYKLSDCPSEFSNIEYSAVLEKFCINQLVEGEKYVIYGKTLFSIVLNEWIKKNRGYYLPVILPKDIDKNFYLKLKYVNPDIIFEIENKCSLQKKVNYFVTDEWYISNLINSGVHASSIINLYDISDREETYYHPEIEQYKDIHRSETCFIIGHGPSLQASDLDILEKNNVITFSMNWTYKLFDRTDWRPDYYVACDRGMIDRYSYFKWDEHTKRKCFIADMSEAFWRANQSENNVKYHSIRNMNTRKVKFSKDISRRVYYGANVVYDCLQIALYMGFEKIYLLGTDLVPYEKGDESAYSYSNFYEVDSSKKRPQMWVDKILRAYQAAKEYAEAHDAQIYNATRGGYLEVFERVDFDELFGNDK